MRGTLAVASVMTLQLVGSAIAQPPGDGPVASWTFNEQLRGLVRDTSGHDHHGFIRGEDRCAPAPGGVAVTLDGHSTMEVRDTPLLRATRALTIDLWVYAEDVNAPGTQYLVDKAGERYHLWLSQGGAVGFGLKDAEGRVDISGGKLQSRQWHRITATWARPELKLYVDGQPVASREWDREPGPGGNLYLGSQSGSDNLFTGQVDELRIYAHARPPVPDDAPTTAIIGGAAVSARITSEQTGDGFAVSTGACQFELTRTGVLRRLGPPGRMVVEGNEQPLLSAEVFESADYDGWRDYAAGRIVAATWRPNDCTVNAPPGDWTADITGALDFGGGDLLDCRLTVSAAQGSPCVSVGLRAEPQGTFANRFLRSLAIRLPLALDRRKRVVQAGDRGLQWDTRHWYQFTISPGNLFMPEPDHNVWGRFVIDQNSFRDFCIWRSESDATSPLVMQRGEQAPGWMAAYDQQKGVLFGYREMYANAPKSLEVRAEGAGEATAYLWSSTQAPLPVTPDRALFREPQVTTWLPFAEEFRFAQPDLTLAKHWQQESLASDPPARAEVPAAGVKLFTAGPADDVAPLISGGVPLPKGVLTDPTNVRLRREDADVPLQVRPLGFWPDGSIKWLLLTFALDGGQVTAADGEGRALQFEVNRRDGSKTAYRLDYGGTARCGAPAAPLQASAADDRARINTGPLELELTTGASWLATATLNGKPVLGPGGVRSFVDFVRPEGNQRSGDTLSSGRLDPGEFVAQKLELEEAGPLRAVVRLEGMTGSEEPQRVILRLEAYAGRSCVRVFQTVEFLHKDPREAFVRRMGLSVPLADSSGVGVNVGLEDSTPYLLPDSIRYGIRQHSHLGYQAWHQDAVERSLQTDNWGQRCEGWLDVTGANGGIAVVLRDMWQQAPNELTFDRRDGNLTVYVWPESMPPMDMRRYSNYPHRGQGESAGTSSDWVAQDYYPHDPVVGVSRTHEIVLYFHAPAQQDDPDHVNRILSLAADVQERPLMFCGPEWYQLCAVVLPGYTVPDPGKFRRLDANLEHFAHFWLHHQKLWGWYGLWDYGDVRHLYQTGYGWVSPPEELLKALQMPDWESGRAKVSPGTQDYRPNHDWAFDNGRWGWGNTEGLPNLFLQTQYLRTGDRDLFFLCEAMARHERDVDMRHDGTWFGLGTRHGVQHWSDGNHEERQTTQSETRFHYYLTGEARTRDFARQLYEKVYSQRDVRVHAAHSGRLQGLLTWWEMTGDPEVGKLLDAYVGTFITPEGISEQPDDDFPEVTRRSAPDVNSGNMFFWVFGAGHGLLEYYYLTGREDLKAGLIAAADAVMQRGKGPGMMLKTVAFAARHAADPAPYQKYLDDWLQQGWHGPMLQIVPHNPLFYSGPKSFVRSSVPGAWFLLNDEPYLMTAIPGDPVLPEEAAAELQRVDEQGGVSIAPTYLSWQTQYDRPDLQEYLRTKHPQP